MLIIGANDVISIATVSLVIAISFPVTAMSQLVNLDDS
jgi:hypothetical protein